MLDAKKSGGEFAIYGADGQVTWIPNTFTKAGIKALLRNAFWQTGGIWRVGLCANPPGEVISLADIVEPAETNGYSRIELPLNMGSWPVIDELIGQVFIKSQLITFNLTGPTSIAVNRLFITDNVDVLAISTPLEQSEGGGLVTPDSPFSTNYRFFIR